MQQNDTFIILDKIEEYITLGIPFWRKHTLVLKKDLDNKIQELYNSLPQELIENKNYLNMHKKENIFSLINQMYLLVKQSKTFSKFVLINTESLVQILDIAYTTLPDDIKYIKQINR